ncbi:MAG: hypothetical protein KatS3mg033_1672 [Thermonema sp.]|uniref:hypothetical protein n=1 Tax=Thermonema sp. TaxID=2231181 RepID=UPI0021DD6C46|nr:hypothetical protein [Thermonema sp.]GIV39872.1 MAG: hypothetical protein KatS3mg033_1672 [Thermonema sp.]
MDTIQIHLIYGAALIAVVIVMSLWIMWLHLKNKSLTERNKELYELIFQRLDMVTNSSDYALIIRQNNQLRKQFEDLKEVVVEYIVHHLQRENTQPHHHSLYAQTQKNAEKEPTQRTQPHAITPGATIIEQRLAFEEIANKKEDEEDAFTEELLIQEALHLIQAQGGIQSQHKPAPASPHNAKNGKVATGQERSTSIESKQEEEKEQPGTTSLDSIQKELNDVEAAEQMILKRLYAEALDLINQALSQSESLTECAVLLIEKLIVQKALRANSEATEEQIDEMIRRKVSLQFDFSRLNFHIENEMEQVPYIERRLIQMKMQLLSMKR